MPIDHAGSAQQAAKDAGLTGVTFEQDPTSRHFAQVRFSDERQKREYMKLRKVTDRNSRNGGGAILTQAQIERAKSSDFEDSR